MTFAADFASNGLSNAFIASPRLADTVSATIAIFDRLSIDDRLAVLGYSFIKCGCSIGQTPPRTARLQLAEGLLDRIKQMSQEEQLQVLRDLATRENTQISRCYGIFSQNTKLAFWYKLAKWMDRGSMESMLELSRDARKVLEAIVQMEIGQQINFLRNVVSDMGADALAN